MNELKYIDENINYFRKIILGEFNNSPAGKYFSNNEEFQNSDQAEIGARGDLLFLSYFAGERTYLLRCLQIDEDNIEIIFNKWYQSLIKDIDNQHLAPGFKEWYNLYFLPLYYSVRK
jgi:hypothetical protein